jgi:nitroreductase
VDARYEILKQHATSEPVTNDKYGIYHFFLQDPESRTVEIQAFLNRVNGFMITEECLRTRRSIRHFEETPVPRDILDQVLDICRYSPTSKNSESYYFVVIQSGKKLDYLAGVRGTNSSPIGRAPMAIAICADPTKSRKPDHDACIAAYHFMIAAWQYGLGTCWIGSMDTEEVKTKLGIPQEHYIATITPLGYPAKIPVTPLRRPVQDSVKYTEKK